MPVPARILARREIMNNDARNAHIVATDALPDLMPMLACYIDTVLNETANSEYPAGARLAAYHRMQDVIARLIGE